VQRLSLRLVAAAQSVKPVGCAAWQARSTGSCKPWHPFGAGAFGYADGTDKPGIGRRDIVRLSVGPDPAPSRDKDAAGRISPENQILALEGGREGRIETRLSEGRGRTPGLRRLVRPGPGLTGAQTAIASGMA